jgi:hypothetical protein
MRMFRVVTLCYSMRTTLCTRISPVILALATLNIMLRVRRVGRVSKVGRASRVGRVSRVSRVSRFSRVGSVRRVSDLPRIALAKHNGCHTGRVTEENTRFLFLFKIPYIHLWL